VSLLGEIEKLQAQANCAKIPNMVMRLKDEEEMVL
jgi:hypothetical protein